MREWEISYIGWKDLPRQLDGTEHKWPANCHHAHYVAGISVREVTNTDAVSVQEPALERCNHCGNPLIEDWNGAHYSCSSCRQVTTACCSGAGEGESG